MLIDGYCLLSRGCRRFEVDERWALFYHYLRRADDDDVFSSILERRR